ncbi:alkylation response protein AidB-like acyl-CoA dehydrogenase [Streptomyces sp. SAI-041]|nr:alkylation response protein AidB-like acyl-CoA dehydrogenase [Streptomyces sp. SAI-041]
MTEPLGGSDVAGGMRATARREGDTWVLNGAEKWIGNGTFADHVVVQARDEDDNHVKGFVVEKGTPGFDPVKIENKLAFRIVEHAEITLTDVRVPEADRLQNINSLRDVAEILRATRAGVAWQALGVMTGAYELALDYARERRQFGRPIGGFQLVQDLLVKSLGNITASGACSCSSPVSRTPASSATNTPRWPRRSSPRGCGRSSPGAVRSSAATSSSWTTTWPASSPTPRRSTPSRAPAR